MDPQQELFAELMIKLEEIGYGVYDGALPPEDTPYPFIYVADSQQVDDINKSAVFGNVYQTIHVWHNNPKQRGTVSAILLAVKDVCRKITHTKNFAWYVVNVNQRILADTTTKQPLMHGILDVEFRFS